MIEVLRSYVIPAAYYLLPVEMVSEQATAMLLAIALQESSGRHRQQMHGSARGFWQFEVAGVRGVLEHPDTAAPITASLRALGYDSTMPASAIQPLLEHNDILAACFARCLLWTDPKRLPERSEADYGWVVYLSTWRPGKPRPDAWEGHFVEAWDRTRLSGALRA